MLGVHRQDLGRLHEPRSMLSEIGNTELRELAIEEQRAVDQHAPEGEGPGRGVSQARSRWSCLSASRRGRSVPATGRGTQDGTNGNGGKASRVDGHQCHGGRGRGNHF